jgi:hypothetical protein
MTVWLRLPNEALVFVLAVVQPGVDEEVPPEEGS